MELLDIQYKLLGITDQKARGLLTINALTIAIIGLFWKLSSLPLQKAGCLFVLAFPLVSSILCMWAIRIDWLFYKKVSIVNAHNKKYNLRDEINSLSEVIVLRYWMYLVAWCISFALFISILFFVLIVGIWKVAK